MKKIISIALCIFVLLVSTGCDLITSFLASIDSNIDTEKLSIGGIDASKNIELTENNQHFDFEICKQYTVYLQVKEEDYKEDLYTAITNRYNVSTTKVCYSYSNGFSNVIAYSLYPLSKSENNQISFAYKDKVYAFTYDIVDYDFANHGCKKPASLSDLSVYPEFTEAINSLSYHQFQGPFVGLDSYSSSYYEQAYHWRYDFYNEEEKTYLYNTEYLKYLTDSVYYPARLDMVNQNPIAARTVGMTFIDDDAVKAGADRTVMERFSISYTVIDPCCTNPTYPLQSYSYTAIPKESNATSETIKKEYIRTYYTTYYQLCKTYPEQYFHMTIGELDIAVLELASGSVCAFFEDSTYIYQVYFSYSVVER